MEQIINALVAEINEFITTNSSGGGIADVITVNGPTRWGDPGIVTIDEYPFFYVEPQRHEPSSSTMSTAGWKVRTAYVQCCFVVNSADYFDPASSDVPATRECVKVGEALWLWLQKFSNIHLGTNTGTQNVPKVRNVTIQSVDYVPQVRGTGADGVFTRLAVVTVAVEKQWPNER